MHCGVFCSRSQVGENIKRCVFMPACVCAAEKGRKKKGQSKRENGRQKNERERLSGTKTTLAETA